MGIERNFLATVEDRIEISKKDMDAKLMFDSQQKEPRKKLEPVE